MISNITHMFKFCLSIILEELNSQHLMKYLYKMEMDWFLMTPKKSFLYITRIICQTSQYSRPYNIPIDTSHPYEIFI
jgi:hypothetical protein